MIIKLKYGSPIETDAVVSALPLTEKLPEYITAERSDESIALEMKLGEDDVVYGLGEALRGINKRGWRYESMNSDDPNHTESKRSLYASHNVLFIDGARKYGVFVDNPGFVSFDVAAEKPDTVRIECSADLYLYVLEGTTIPDIVREFRALIGRSYLAPRWAMGYIQSRWGYFNEADIRGVWQKLRENDIPVDGISMDIDYMEDYKDFTVGGDKFPDLKALSAELRDNGVHLVPIIDAGVKIEDGYDIYEQGRDNGYFCRREDGTYFVGGVWPGRTHFPDFLNADARRWFGNAYSRLLDLGIDGFWNDMNEPAIFYSDEGLREAAARYGELISKPLSSVEFFELRGIYNDLANSDKDYHRFYHDIGGKRIPHYRVHNIYGFNMTRAAAEAFDTLCPNKRILMFSRSSYIGAHRYGGVWTGDNQSWWSHLLLNIKMMPSLNMCGFLYSGADIGGFGGDTTDELLLRWLQFGIFTPLFRNHSAIGTVMQEPYRFPHLDAMRAVIKLRYRLLPFLYSEYMKAALDGEMYLKPLSFGFPQDKRCREVEDQLLLGDSLMLAPVYEQNARGRYVYLPEEMLYIRFNADGSYSCEKLSKGYKHIECGLTQTPLFIRKNHFVLLAEAASSTAQIDTSRLYAIGCFDGSARYELYEDDGSSKAYDSPTNRHSIELTGSGRFEIDGRKISADIR